jgi:SAM-dependent methyltransferase
VSDWHTELFERMAECGIRSDPEGAARDVDWLLSLRNSDASLDVLDVGCGEGRHAIAFAERGHRVVGLDSSERLLAAGRARAQARSLSVEWRRGDMRAMDFDADFDLVLFMDVAFGMFDEAGDIATLQAAARAVRPTGIVVLELFNPYWWAGQSAPRRFTTADGTNWSRTYDFDCETGVLTDRLVREAEGLPSEPFPEARYRCYTMPEVSRLAGGAGLLVKSVWYRNGWTEIEPTPVDPRMLFCLLSRAP